jgi:hypothetical protein
MYAQPLPNNASRAQTASVMMIISIVLFAIQTLKSLYKMTLDEYELESSTSLLIGEGILGIIQFFITIISAIFFIMWFRRAYNNLHICGVKELPYKEGWAAGGWFVPFISLYYPYRIMNSIWSGTQSAIRKIGEHYQREEDGYIGWWWTFWIIANLISNIEAQITLRGLVSPFNPGTIAMELISNSSMLLAGWLCWRLIGRTAALEEDLQGRYAEWLTYQTQQQAEQFQQTLPANPEQ